MADGTITELRKGADGEKAGDAGTLSAAVEKYSALFINQATI